MDFDAVVIQLPTLLMGALRSVLYAVGGYSVGLSVAAVATVARLAYGRWATMPIQVFVEVIRNTPFLLQSFFVYFGLAELGLVLPGYLAAIFIVTINSSAYNVEILRSGVLSIPAGLVEAGESMGMTSLQLFHHVIARPMLRTSMPALSGQFVIMLLNTSLLYAIGIPELNYEASNLASLTFRPFEVYVATALIYLSISSVFALAFAAVARLVTGSWGVEQKLQAAL